MQAYDYDFIKKRLQYSCFTGNFSKFFKTAFSPLLSFAG